MKKVDVTDVAKKIMELYYLGDELYQSPFYSEKTLLIDECSPVTGPGSDTEKGAKSTDRTNCHIIHKKYKTIRHTTETIVVAGLYNLLDNSEQSCSKEKICAVSLVLERVGKGVKIALLHISAKPKGRTYVLRDAQEQSFFMDEADIIYLEAGHNRTRWHCRDKVIETSKNLLYTEKSLSDSFVRIHRGFVVNRQHVNKIGRYFVEMDAGMSLPIPAKKYMTVRELLLKA